ncbi:MAG: STAS domain-containing protein [Ferruginibacter sp.]
MNVKTDTKEKFTVITPISEHIPANMTGELEDLLLSYQNREIPHIILNLSGVQKLDQKAGEKIAEIQQKFYDNNISFIVCELQKEPEEMLDHMKLLEVMNVTPTVSEAWDIVQMEEIERELNDD